jgi:hypothetical protein
MLGHCGLEADMASAGSNVRFGQKQTLRRPIRLGSFYGLNAILTRIA